MNIAIYVRVSTQEQAEHGYSIDEQIERCKQYAAAYDWNIYHVYTDAGFSGANMQRPALQEMIRDIRKFKKILVWKLDRLSRSQKDTLYLIEDIFLKNGVEFVSMNENFDTASPFGRAMIGILAVFAQLEREQIKERMQLGKEARAKAGLYIGNQKKPIGYGYINGALITNEFEKIQIQKAFEMCASGASNVEIIQTLNNAGLTHKYGEWKTATLHHVLRNKLYAGYIYYHGNYYKGQHEPIVPECLYERVQAVLNARKRAHEENHREGKITSYFGGLIRCARCGAKYAKRPRYKRNAAGEIVRYDFYMCYSKTKSVPHLVKDPRCNNKNYRMETFDNLIFDEIKKLKLSDTAPDPKRINVKPLRNEIKKIDNQISNLLDLYLSDGVPREMLDSKLSELNAKKEKIENELSEADNKKQRRKDATKYIDSFADILERGTFQEIRSVITALIQEIVIDGDNIEIHWNF